MNLAKSCRLNLLPRLGPLPTRITGLRLNSTKPPVEVDDLCIPLQPTWSVNELLSSYPKPTISPSKLAKLHELSALIPPVPDSPEHSQLTNEMEELARLVEAVRLVELTDEEKKQKGVPDGRVWAEGKGLDMDEKKEYQGNIRVAGRRLLRLAKKREGEYYIVEADRRRRTDATSMTLFPVF